MRFICLASIHPRLSFLMFSAIAAALLGSSAFLVEHRHTQASSITAASILWVPGAVEFDQSDESDQPDINPAPQPHASALMAEAVSITIDRCNGIAAHANLRAGSSQQSDRLGIIARGDRVQLIGRQQGAYYWVRAWYWVDDPVSAQVDPQWGRGWIHHCWLKP